MTETQTHKLTPTQIRTLRTVIRNGGEMNGYSGQPGYSCKSEPVLVRLGYLHMVGTCACFGQKPCDIEHRDLFINGRTDRTCYDRVRITDAGRDALAADLADALS